MKKIFVCFFVVLCLSISIFADGYYVGKGMSGKRLAIHEPEFKNINSNDSVYLHDLVFILRTYFHDYAGFDMVDIQNQDKIQKLQAKSESSKYDDKTTLTAGKLQFAEYEAFVSVSKAGSVYSLSLNITDLTTMKIIASSIVKNINKVTDIDSVGVRNLMLDIIPKMGVQLSAMGKYSLSGNKTDNLTTEQELHFAKQEEKSLQENLDKLNSELKNYSKTDTDMDSVAKKAQLEVDKQLAEKRLVMAQERTARLIEQQEKEAKEKIKATERSQEVNKRITSLSNDVETVAAEIRNKKFNNLSYSEQILVIEKNKKAYLELRNKIEEEIKALYADANKEYNERKINVNDVSQYKKAELSNGVPLENAKNIRTQQNLELYNSLMSVAQKNEQEIRNETQLDNILKDIKSKELTLSKPQTINSLEDTTLLSIGNYDGKHKAWIGNVKIKKDGKVLITDSFPIYFNDLSKALNGRFYTIEEMDGQSSLSKYNSYIDDVETFDSLFNMGTPLVNLDVELVVKPLSKDNPSGYSISVSKYTVKATTTNKIVATVPRSNVSCSFYSTPAYDMRTKEELAQFNNKKQQEKARQQAKIIKEQSKKIANQKRKGGMLCALGLDSDLIINGLLFAELPLTNKIFVGGDLSCTLGDIDLNQQHTDLGVRLGFVNYLPIGNYPGLFSSFGLGCSIYYNAVFYCLGEVGIDFDIGGYVLEFKYQVRYDKNSCFTDVYYIGVGMNLDYL